MLHNLSLLKKTDDISLKLLYAILPCGKFDPSTPGPVGFKNLVCGEAAGMLSVTGLGIFP